MRVVTRVVVILLGGTLFLLTGCPWAGNDGEDDGDHEDDWTPVEVEWLCAVAGNAAVRLSWSEPAGSYDHLEVSWTPGGESGETVHPVETSYLASGLTKGVAYMFTVRVFGDEDSSSDGMVVTSTPIAQYLYGGTGTDAGRSVTRTTTGGFVVAGSTESAELQDDLNVGAPDVYVIRIDSEGALDTWRSYGGSNDEVARHVVTTSDNDYLLAGDWEVIDGEGDDFLALCLDTSFARVFERALGGTGHDHGEVCLETLDDGFVFAGESFSADIPDATYNLNGDGFVVKFDADGNTLWQEMFGGTGWDRLHGMIESSDGSLVVAGSSYSTNLPGSTQDGIDDFYLAKLDADGSLQWQTMYGGTWQDCLSSMDKTTDGGLIVAGYSGSNDLTGLAEDSGNGYVAKLDTDGEVVWHRRIGGDGAWLLGVESTTSGGYVVVGYGYAEDSQSQQGYLAELTSVGAVVRELYLGGTSTEYLYDIVETAGGFVAAGSSDSTDIPGMSGSGGEDVYVVMVDSQ